MRHIVHSISLLTIIFFSNAFLSFGQDELPKDFPRVLLVQLKSEQSKIAAMTRDKNYVAAEEVRKDAMGVRNSMIADFNHHFTYCPVYYYLDTNEDLIKAKHFEGVVMNADGSVVSNLPASISMGNYAVVYYGYYTSQPKSGKVAKGDDEYAPDATPGKGLVILNDNFQQISYVYALGYSSAAGKKKAVPDRYISRHYDIEYFPLATLLNKTLSAKRGKHGRIKTAAMKPF